MLVLKTAAWYVTGSAALFSDAAETVVNVAAAAMAFAALRFAARPADANHPYGHDKAEFFAAVIEGTLIVLAAVVILDEAWAAWRHPAPLQAPAAGSAMNAVSTADQRRLGLAAGAARPGAALGGAGRRRAARASPTSSPRWAC